jgi:hypothetical protein
MDKRLGGPQSRSGQHGEVKILAPHRDSNSDPLVVQPVASRYPGNSLNSHIYAKFLNRRVFRKLKNCLNYAANTFN